MQPKARFASTNSYGIPDLVMPDVSPNPPPVPRPCVIWGSVSRAKRNPGLFAFYCDDYRFGRLWTCPDYLTATDCQASCEPNYSVVAEDTRIEALWATYRKRWLARYWQEAGVEIWVDLHVGDGHEETNLIGVPEGWQRYATAGSDRDLGLLDRDLHIATVWATNNPFTLLVYGGGKATAQWCVSAGAVHIPHRSADRKR